MARKGQRGFIYFKGLPYTISYEGENLVIIIFDEKAIEGNLHCHLANMRCRISCSNKTFDFVYPSRL
ncbi:hypothetical protein RJT34_07036 [Clitoria ternatea]|uniref:Uncharacterized protein n=1 Tax=Clitoria ternatea TaxID=43366 RepID=A0AAN9K4W2_CLITE